MKNPGQVLQHLFRMVREKASLDRLEAGFTSDFKIALLGEEERCRSLGRLLLGDESCDPKGERCFHFLPLPPPPGSREEVVDSSLILICPGPQGAAEVNESLFAWLPRGVPVLRLEAVGDPDEVCINRFVTGILKLVPRLELPLARRFPPFREEVVKNLIQRNSRQNLVLAVASAIPADVPVLGAIASLFSSAGETLIITANQVRLALEIAGVYGSRADFFERMPEILPLLGGALGWRALAREAAGFIPLGGPVLKGAVAFAGTMVVGQAARWYYGSGRKLTRMEQSEIYRKALCRARNLLKESIGKMKKRQPQSDLEGAQKRTPAPAKKEGRR